ncbi:hypothetical protein LCGC14_0232320 [marine sediment metagenome]|uniref:Uncharacterized protein n=1 Tax=marine sediment metagenome TaxID=412755 RepID=A0A0F9WUS7_9ZZZZ
MQENEITAMQTFDCGVTITPNIPGTRQAPSTNYQENPAVIEAINHWTAHVQESKLKNQAQPQTGNVAPGPGQPSSNLTFSWGSTDGAMCTSAPNAARQTAPLLQASTTAPFDSMIFLGSIHACENKFKIEPEGMDNWKISPKLETLEIAAKCLLNYTKFG